MPFVPGQVIHHISGNPKPTSYIDVKRKKVITCKSNDFFTEDLDEERFETRDITGEEERLYNILSKAKNKFNVNTSLREVPDFFKK